MIFKFTITGREDEVVEFEKELMDVLLRILGDKDVLAHEIHFCVHEALLNVIQHTYKWNLSQPIEIRVQDRQENSDQVLEIFLRDYGEPVSGIIEPPKQIERFQLRKRGLFMISKIMDEFYIEPQEKNGNITYMKKRYR